MFEETEGIWIVEYSEVDEDVEFFEENIFNDFLDRVWEGIENG